MERSVERIEGVKRVKLDLNTGHCVVRFHPGHTVSPEKLWEAIKDSGFTPTRIVMQDRVYEGPDE